MKKYINPNWKDFLTENNLTTFDDVWDAAKNWVEPPNYRRGGMSGVALLQLGTKTFFVKKQINHRCKTISKPVFGISTLEREVKNIINFQAHNIPTLEPVLFLKQGRGKHQKAILVTQELTGYIPLDKLLVNFEGSLALQCQLIENIARAVAKIHHLGFVHSCLYAKHIFIRLGDFDIKFIDLEKAKRLFCKKKSMLRDLSALDRHTNYGSITHGLRFLKAYLSAMDQSQLQKKIIKQLVKRHRRKLK